MSRSIRIFSGNRVTAAAPGCDGEDELFDVDEFADLRHFPNLKSMTLLYTGNEEALEMLRARGIDANWL